MVWYTISKNNESLVSGSALLDAIRAPHAYVSLPQSASSINALQNDIFSLQGAIVSLEKQVHLLKGTIDERKRDIDRHISLAAPIRRLPSEILSRIMVLAAGENRGSHFTLRLSGICHWWREIILEIPELWTNISVPNKDFQRDQLVRSKGRPLTIQVKFTNAQDQDVAAFFQQHASWVEEVHFNQKPSRYSFRIDSVSIWSLRLDFPILKYIEYPLGWNPMLFMDFFSRAPALRVVALQWPFHSPIGNPYPYSLKLPWNTVRELKMSEYFVNQTLSNVLVAIARGEHLQRLECTYERYAAHARDLHLERPAPDEKLISSSITSFRFLFSEKKDLYEVVGQFFQITTFTSLSSLHLEIIEDNRIVSFSGHWPRATMQAYLVRSGCLLTTLSLIGLPINHHDVTSLLKFTPSLITLTLSEYDTRGSSSKYPIITDLIPQLYSSSTTDVFATQHPLVPKLTSLKLEVGCEFCADNAFVELAKARWWECSPQGMVERLRTLVLRVWRRKLVPEVYEPLKLLDADGMMISVFNDKERVI